MRFSVLCLVMVGCLVQGGLGVVENTEQEILMNKYSEARKAFTGEDLDLAIMLLEDLMPFLGEETPSIYADLAVAYMMMNRIADSYKTYRDGLELHPQEGMLHRGFCQFGSKFIGSPNQPEEIIVEDVIESCVTGINKKPNEAIMYKFTAKLLWSQGYAGDAMTFLEKGVGIVEKIYKRNENNKKRGREDRVDAEKDEANIELYFEMMYSLAVMQLQKGDPDKALGLAQLLMELDANRFSPLVARIRTFVAPNDELGSELLKEQLLAKAADCKARQCVSGFNVAWDWEDLQNDNAKVEQINKDTALLPFGPGFFVGEEEEKQQYSTHKIYHAEMKDFELVGSGGLLRQSCQLIPGAHKQLLAFSDFCKTSKPSKMSFDVPVFSLFPIFDSRNYFNWLMEGVTRVVQFEKMFSDVFAEGGYRLLVPEGEGFVGETLELLLGKKGMEKVVQLSGDVVHMDSPVHLLNWLAPQDSVVYKHNTWSALFPPKEMLELTRSRIFELIGVNKKKEAVKVVYVKREEKEGGSRFIKGQDLEEKMKGKCAELGADFVVHTGTESVKDQMKLFSEADVVIGPQGAGMGNILFCQPGTLVRPFPMTPRVDDSVRYLSAALDLNFQEVETVLSTRNGNYGELSEAQIEDVLDAITDAVKEKNDKGTNCLN